MGKEESDYMKNLVTRSKKKRHLFGIRHPVEFKTLKCSLIVRPTWFIKILEIKIFLFYRTVAQWETSKSIFLVSDLQLKMRQCAWLLVVLGLMAL